MIANWEAIPLLVGFVLEFILYSKYQFRAGGVIVLPILAVYFVLYPFFVPILLGLSLLTYIILEILYGKIIIYGRRLLYLALSIGITFSLIASYILAQPIGTYGFLIPGLLAYNIHREQHSPVMKLKSLVLNSAVFILLVMVAAASLLLV